MNNRRTRRAQQAIPDSLQRVVIPSMRVPNFGIEHHRIRRGEYASTNLDGNNGAFRFRFRKVNLLVIASDGMGWEHASVSLIGQKRCPIWEELCFVKDQFWRPEECVIQYHPPRSEYVNNHQYVLHLWSPVGVELPLPPGICVGIKDAGVINTPEQAEGLREQLEARGI